MNANVVIPEVDEETTTTNTHTTFTTVGTSNVLYSDSSSRSLRDQKKSDQKSLTPVTAPAFLPESGSTTLNPESSSFNCGENNESCLEFFLIVQREGLVNKTLWSYPFPIEVVEAKYPMLWEFVFPSATPSCAADDLSHTFVLTDGHGVRVYGHCTIFVNNEVAVSLSPYPWCHFFTHLAMLLRIYGHGNGKRIVQAISLCRTPPPGEIFQSPVAVPITFRRPCDGICPFIDSSPLDLLTIFPDSSILFSLLADLLLEKHIIVVGPNFGLVSRVVMSLQTLIAPFEWLHMLIPILPTNLLDVLAAPTPYLVGILTSQLPVVNNVPIERCVIVHLGSSGTCECVCYHSEERHKLPNTGTFSAFRMRYKILCLRGEYSKTVQDICSLFLTHYASLFGGIGLSNAKSCMRSRYNRVDTRFYESLFDTQCFTTLASTVREALAGSDHVWMNNEFIVKLVKGNADIYVRHHQKLVQNGCVRERGLFEPSNQDLGSAGEPNMSSERDYNSAKFSGSGAGQKICRFLRSFFTCSLCRGGINLERPVVESSGSCAC